MPFIRTQALDDGQHRHFTLSLRIRLILVVVSALAPLVGLGAVHQYRQYQADRDQLYDGLLTSVRDAAASVERDLRQRIVMLETLAMAPSLQSGDLDQFAVQAKAFLSRQMAGATLGVATPDLQQHKAYGTGLDQAETLPRVTATARARQVFDTAQPSVGNLQIGHPGAVPSFAVNVPVLQDGHVIYDLFLMLMPHAVIDSLDGQRPPPQTVLSIVDAAGAIVAQIPSPNKYLNNYVVPERWRIIQSRPEGFASTADAKGTPAVTAFSHIGMSGWSVAVVVPKNALFAPLRGEIVRSAGIGLLVLAAGLLVAALMARAITRPVEQLGRLAQQDDGADPAEFVSGMPEANAVAGMLARAASDRRNVALALAESEQRFRTLFERSPSGTILLDPETACVLDCNEAAASFVGCTVDEFRGANIIEFSLQTTPERIREICRSVVSGRIWQYETRVRGRQMPRDLLVAVAPVQVSGRTLILITQIDITDLHDVQADLRVNQERLELARQGANLGIWDWNIARDRLTWSDHQWHLHGLEPHPEGVTPQDWERVVHPADLPHARFELRAALKTANHLFATEYTVIMPDGSFRRLMGRGQTIRDADGRAVRMVGINMDVTARYEAEMARDQLICVLETERSRLSDIIEALPIGVGIIDAAGRIVLGNGITNRLVGPIIPCKDIAPHDTWIAFHPDGSRVTPHQFPGALALHGETALPGKEFLFSPEDGTKTWIRIGATPLRWEDGQVQEALIVLLDIDAEKRLLDIQQQTNLHLEQRVREEVAAREVAQQRAAQAERMYALGQIAGGIAHDFNNILQAVSGGAALIERRPGDPERVLRHARMVADAAKRGATITSRLLAFARRGDLRAESIDALALLTDMAEVLTHTLGGSVVCEVEVPAELPRLFADRGQLETVLVNLATNARDAMPSGGILTLSANAETVLAGAPHPVGIAAGDYIRIVVKDTGLGMSRTVLARVTEPFFTTKEPGKGTGLGLAMAKGFAEQSDGSLSIESTEGQGTSIILWLPQDREKVTTKSNADFVRTPGAVRPRILLVDDDAIVRQVLVLSLEDSGYAVLSAESGGAALALLAQGERVDIIVSDLTMPVMDGLALIHAAQERRPGLPAVLLTGYVADDAALAVGGAISGSFSLLRKPVSGIQLIDRITALLETGNSVRPMNT